MASSNAPRKRISKNTSSKKSSAKKSAASKKSAPMRREVKIFIAGFIAFVILLSYYTPVFGVFGRFIKNMGLAVFGASGYIIPLFIAALVVHKSVKRTVKPYGRIYLSVAGIAVLLSCFLTITASGGDTKYLASSDAFSSFLLLVDGGIQLTDGGIVGALGIPIMSFFGVTGSKIILVFFMVVLFAAATNFMPIILSAALVKRIASYIGARIEESRSAAEEEEEEYYEEESLPVEPKKKKRTAVSEESSPNQTEINFEEFKEEKPKKARKSRKKPVSEDSEAEPAKDSEPAGGNFDEMHINIFIPNSSSEESEPIPAVKTEEAPAPKKEPNTSVAIKEDELITETEPYVFPPINLLARNTERGTGANGADLRELAKKLIETLHSFGVEAKVLEVSKGPSVTRFEIQPNTGVKVSKIVGLADDIALNLAAISVRIEAPIPGKAAVGIEIPNAGNSIVRLREVIDCPEFAKFKAKTAFALGKDITGTPVIADISKMPHALIAGATGSGKSVCINSLITSILYKADPSEVKLIMIDPKVVELSVYNGIPHLLIPVVTDPRKAAGALNWAVQEMTKRYSMFAESNVRDIKGYNELAKMSGEPTLPKIIIIVDELADLMMVAPRDVEDAICRLAQLARAAGMHLVVATQRPSVDVVTGLIKANIPTRIAFAVSSQIDSRTILDMGGAEKLLGKGDMLYLPTGASKPIRIQGAFIDDREVNNIVSFIKQPEAVYDEDVLEKIESAVSGEKETDAGDADELLPKAIEIVVEANQASASLLQRRLKVGYSRAGRLIDQLEERGIIGPHEGAKPRAVLISRAEYAEMIMQSE